MINAARVQVRASAVVLGLWALLVSLLVPVSASADEGLGIAVRVLPEVGTEVENNNYLWLSASPNSSSERTIEVTSQSDIPQRIYFEVFDELNVDGELTIDPENSSEAFNWLTFSPTEAVLQPGQTITFQARFNPKGEDLNYFGFLRIYAEAAEQQQIEDVEGETYRAYIAGRAAIRIPVWFGTGTGTSAVTDFAITGLRGVIVEGENKIQLTIQNAGDTPIAPNGFVEFADPAFASLKAGPYPFRTNTIRPGQTVGILIDIDETLTEQPWRAIAEARQGPIVRTRTFDLQLTFVELGNTNSLALVLQIGMVLVGLALAFLGLRLFRSKEREARPSRAERTPRAMRPPRTTLARRIDDREEPSVEELIERIRLRSEADAQEEESPARVVDKPETRETRISVGPAPEPTDPWAFLHAARQAKWADTYAPTEPEPKPKSAAKKPPTAKTAKRAATKTAVAKLEQPDETLVQSKSKSSAGKPAAKNTT